MFVFLSKLLDAAFAPLTWAVALLAIGIVLAWRRSERRRLVAACLVSGLAVLYVFSLAPVAAALTARAERPSGPGLEPTRTYDAVIVLGGLLDVEASEDSGVPAFSDAVDRLIEAHRLVREGRARHLLVSGGNVRAVGPPEATFLAAQLERWGLPADRIVVEPRSRNTRENAVESARIVRERGWTSLVLVTSAAHMPRALGCFRALGLEPAPYPVDAHSTRWHLEPGALLPRAEHLARSTVVLRELAGRVIYRLRGWTT